ncbi:hypothetical protein PYCCODRAFT_1418679 [Trametes coccinea BRFM310]|uniref:Integrase core domain-containing protein n=1 Tax=Trametes coccinea (strain BRFM310) TaxID=1353009 RepID=A0A1Y2I9Z9_TRAC3|nr:hypothetical protein PYCCODRAFT_1418679 [Trametes coccinea BRFM310]
MSSTQMTQDTNQSSDAHSLEDERLGAQDVVPLKRRNQHKPCPPEHLLKGPMTYYYTLGLTDAKIAQMCSAHFSTEIYGLSDSTVKRLRYKWGLMKARQQNHSVDSIHPYCVAIKTRFPNRGADLLTKSLRLTYNIRASRKLVADWLNQFEPDAVKSRKHRRFRRHRFWAAGLNDVWSFDQHDKWGRFGLYLHCGVEPMAGEIKWLKIWWNNSNPRLITSYYLEAVRRLGAIPLVTQSDPGTENFGIANAHTYMRHALDPSLCDTLQHRWMRKHMNIKPEILWSVLGRDWKPGFEATLQYGVDHGWYDPANELESIVFRWLAIPWLQAELDAWTSQYNLTARRANKNKVLPQGIPMIIAQHPADYNISDFKACVPVPPELLDDVERQWAPPSHPVFESAPPYIAAKIIEAFNAVGSPVASSETFWPIYLQLLQYMLAPEHQNAEDIARLQACLEENRSRSLTAEPICLIPGLRDLREGDNVVAAATGRDSDEEEVLDVLGLFTDEEDDGDDPGFF